MPLPPFSPTFEIICRILTEQTIEIGFCSTNSQWFTLTAASETLAQSHLCRTGWESQEFIYSLYPLNPFHSHRGLWKDHQSVSHRAITDRQMLIFTVRFLPNDVSWVWEGSVMRKPVQTLQRLGVECCEAAEPPWHLYEWIYFFIKRVHKYMSKIQEQDVFHPASF